MALDDPSPATSATLTATATAADVDGDSTSLTYVWKVDGTTRRTTVTSSLTDTFDLSLAGNGDNGQTVTVTVTPHDGTDDGSPVTDTATVGNAAPVVDSVTIDQASPRTNDVLSATVTSHDPDGDALTTSYQWTMNGGDIAGATGVHARSVTRRQRGPRRSDPGAGDRRRRLTVLLPDDIVAGRDRQHRRRPRRWGSATIPRTRPRP